MGSLRTKQVREDQEPGVVRWNQRIANEPLLSSPAFSWAKREAVPKR